MPLSIVSLFRMPFLNVYFISEHTHKILISKSATLYTTYDQSFQSSLASCGHSVCNFIKTEKERFYNYCKSLPL